MPRKSLYIPYYEPSSLAIELSFSCLVLVRSFIYMSAFFTERDNEHKDQILHSNSAQIETLILYFPTRETISYDLPIDGNYISTATMSIMPTSRGSITLQSADPNDPPVIDPNFHTTEEDKIMVINGTRQMPKMILGTKDGKEMIKEEVFPEGCQPLTLSSTDEEIDKRVQQTESTFFHPAGSASMGKVVDSDLKASGAKGLRVMDASVILVSIAGHYQVVVYAIAEQAADIILASLK